MIFYLNKKYALKYNLMFIFRKSIIIRDFSFFHIMNANENTIKKMFKNTFSTYSYFIKRFKIEFITRRSRWNKLKRFYFNSSISNSFLNNINISISLLNRLKSNLNKFWCFFNIFFIRFLYFDFQCFKIFVLNIMTLSRKSTI